MKTPTGFRNRSDWVIISGNASFMSDHTKTFRRPYHSFHDEISRFPFGPTRKNDQFPDSSR